MKRFIVEQDGTAWTVVDTKRLRQPYGDYIMGLFETESEAANYAKETEVRYAHIQGVR